MKISFEGKTLTCRAGTSVAVALWEQGIRVLSHSPKYGHPRGMVCARGQCTSCLMRIDGQPNVRSCEHPIQDGMDIRRQDSGAIYGPALQKAVAVGHGFFPVGFYYKWFTRPPFVSRLFLHGIRPLTGVGRLPTGQPPQTPTPEDLGTFETVVVGAGLSGLGALHAASGPVLLIDENRAPGGPRAAALERVAAAGNMARLPLLANAHAHLHDAVRALDNLPGLQSRWDHRVVGGYRPDGLLVRSGDQLKTLRCRHLVWAAGAMDALGVFPGNDTPGLIGPRALYRLLMRDGLDVHGGQVLLVGGGMDFWLSASLLAACGARPSLILTDTDGRDEIAAAVESKWPLHTGLALGRIEPSGNQRLLASFNPRGCTASGRGSHLDMETDLVVICRRGKPIYDIPHQLGRELALYPDLGGFLPTGAGRMPLRGVLPGGLVLDVRGEAAGLLPGRDTTEAETAAP